MINWNGVFPAITTKFTSDDQLDIKTFQSNIQIQMQAGVHGIILGGSLGEASTLKSSEKESLVKATLEVVGDRIPVVMTIAEQSTKEALEAVSVAKDSGIKGFMVLPPMRYKADDRETVTFFKKIAKSTDLPIMIYNNPIDYKILVTLDMFGELEEFKNIQAVKESTRDLSLITKMINRFGERFKILCGVDPLAYESLALGANGWVAGLVCAFPYETIAIYELMQQGRYLEALKIYRWFFPLLELDIHPKLVQYIKLAEAEVGLGTEYVREPRLQLTGEERENILQIIQESLSSRPSLPNLNKIPI
ncbi:dihydrodipicolinate synthase family protein [Cecembia rubra]|uniref:4-hydroxy-tetrahydrodipicolinate synthase n=1 Tax=Cecembia rubra TaxID=1485585 RepID=A0A2P8DWW3_9BACT|nr:dihydrodipicolinate synthase family protein [Cecembia rubra]PSL01694.1 4-hydroxy-tetrahydrodipicolinate synthase [Cecembia rubra]